MNPIIVGIESDFYLLMFTVIIYIGARRYRRSNQNLVFVDRKTHLQQNIFRFVFRINHKHIITRYFKLYIGIRKRNPVMHIMRESRSRKFIFFDRIRIEAIEIFQIRQVGRTPICITMYKTVLQISDIFGQLIERNRYVFVGIQFNNGREQFPTFHLGLYSSKSIGEGLCFIRFRTILGRCRNASQKDTNRNKQLKNITCFHNHSIIELLMQTYEILRLYPNISLTAINSIAIE